MGDKIFYFTLIFASFALLLVRMYLSYLPEPECRLGGFTSYLYFEMCRAFSMVSGCTSLDPQKSERYIQARFSDRDIPYDNYYHEYVIERIYMAALYTCQSYCIDENHRLGRFKWEAHGTSGILGEYVDRFSCPNSHRAGYMAIRPKGHLQNSIRPATLIIAFRGSFTIQNIFDNLPSVIKSSNLSWTNTEPINGTVIESSSPNSTFPKFPPGARAFERHFSAYLEMSESIHKVFIEAFSRYPVCNHTEVYEKSAENQNSTPTYCIDDIMITGHSLGGSLASFCALDWRTRLAPELERHNIIPSAKAAHLSIQLVTFGQIRLGNLEMARYFRSIFPRHDDIWRVTVNMDLVSIIPYKFMDHYHIGREVHVKYRPFSHDSRYPQGESPFASVLESFDITLCEFESIPIGAEDDLGSALSPWMNLHDHVMIFNLTFIDPATECITAWMERREQPNESILGVRHL